MSQQRYTPEFKDEAVRQVTERGYRVLQAGDYKYINEFPHYVANGGSENVGRWHRESADLMRIYREIWDDPADVRLVEVAIFCDSDETASRSVAYFADVRLERGEGSQSLDPG
jgi:hypothetical protein